MSIQNKTIKGWLYNNPLTTDDANDRIARPLMDKPVTNSMVAQLIKESGSEFKYETLLSIIEESDKLKADLLLSGRSVNTPFVNASLGIEGTFNGDFDQFDSNRHKLKASLREGAYFKRIKSQIKVQILGMAPVGPVINQLIDVESGLIDEQLSPGYILKIQGDKIKIAGDHSMVGVHFVNESNEAVASIPASKLAHNNPKEITLTIPSDLPPGLYYVEITTQFTSGNKLLAEPRTYRFQLGLSVE